MLVVYFSGISGYTHKFAQKLTTPTARIPLKKDEPPLQVNEPYILIVPSYGCGDRKVPAQVIKFLNNPDNRKHLTGVIGTGNTNFNKEYCIAAKHVAQKCNVPVLYQLELLGTPEDVQTVQDIIGAHRTQ